MGRAFKAAAYLGALLSLLASANAGAVLYGATGGEPASNLYTIDPLTGATTVIGPIGFPVTGMAFHPTTGVLYGATSNAALSNPHSLITINPLTGAGTLIGDQTTGGDFGVADIAFDDTGTLYGWSEESDDLVTINLATGASTVVGDAAFSTAGSGLIDINGTLFFAGDDSDGSLFTVNKATGALTAVATLTGAPGDANSSVSALAYEEATDTLFGVVNDFGDDVYLVTINRFTGVVTEIGVLLPNPPRFDALAISLGEPADYGDAPLPYPTILALDGARHTPGGPFFGNVAPDVEADGQPDNTATGDDNAGDDDEDGVVVLLNAVGGPGLATVTVGGGNGFVDGFIDFNQDGDWNDAGEQIFSSVFVPVGQTTLQFNAPIQQNPFAGPVFSRFRISNSGGLAPAGPAPDGEVEDYILQGAVLTPPPGNDDNDSGQAPQLLSTPGGSLPLLTLGGLLLAALSRRRRG